MHIEEQNNTRLILKHQRRGMALAILAFTVLSAAVSANLLAQGLLRFSLMGNMQRIGWVLWLALAVGFTVVGWRSWRRMGRGVMCIFDKAQETVAIHHPHGGHDDPRILSIYAISHLDIQMNDEARVYGVFLVLRSSERIIMGTVPPYERDTVRRIQRDVKQFLQSPPVAAE